jgi:hypothetical protein
VTGPYGGTVTRSGTVTKTGPGQYPGRSPAPTVGP